MENKIQPPHVKGIHITSLIGKGHFSRVYKGVLLNEKEHVAVKIIDKNDLSKGKVDVIVSEIGIMKSLNHPHIVKMRDFKWDTKSVYIILEYCEGGNLYEYIKLKNSLKEKIVRRALQQLASGLQYLRSKNLCHMDLKPQNILMKFNPFTIKIADFGLAQYVPEKKYKDNLRGSPLYMAPEILFSDKYDSKVDLWSVGIILYECLYGRAPFAQKNVQELLEALQHRTPIKYPSTIPLSNDCKDLMEKLLTYNPEERISYHDFFNHPFIDLIHAPSVENKKFALKIINEAVKLDEKKNYVEAFNTYCRALRHLVPLLETMTGSEERTYFQIKITEYFTRAEELKSFLFKDSRLRNQFQNVAREELTQGGGNNGMTTISSPKKIEFDDIAHSLLSKQKSDLDETVEKGKEVPFGSSQVPILKDISKILSEEVLPTINIKEAFSSCPRIHSALEIGLAGQMYMLQGDYEIAYSKYEASLAILIPETKNFPPGPRREFLLNLIKKWLSEAEGAKTLASAKSIDLTANTKNPLEAMGSFVR